MSIIQLLIKASWVNVTAAIFAGLISGGCSARLIALINTAIGQNEPQALITPLLLTELKQRGKTVLAISHDDHFFT